MTIRGWWGKKSGLVAGALASCCLCFALFVEAARAAKTYPSCNAGSGSDGSCIRWIGATALSLTATPVTAASCVSHRAGETETASGSRQTANCIRSPVAARTTGEILTRATKGIARANPELTGVFTVDWNQPAPDGQGQLFTDAVESAGITSVASET